MHRIDLKRVLNNVTGYGHLLLKSSKFVEEMQNTLSQITKDGKKCFVLGDINIDLAPTNRKSIELINMLKSNVISSIIT